MALLFAATFNNGFDEFAALGGDPRVERNGTSNTNCACCPDGDGSFAQTFTYTLPAPVGNVIGNGQTVFQFAWFADTLADLGDPGVDIRLLMDVYLDNGLVTIPVQTGIRGDGAVAIAVNGNVYTSAPGVHPPDGVQRGVQWTGIVSYDGANYTVDFEVFVNNVSVIANSDSFASAVPPGASFDITVTGYSRLEGDVDANTRVIEAMDDVAVYDTATPISWAGHGARVLTKNSCTPGIVRLTKTVVVGSGDTTSRDFDFYVDIPSPGPGDTASDDPDPSIAIDGSDSGTADDIHVTGVGIRVEELTVGQWHPTYSLNGGTEDFDPPVFTLYPGQIAEVEVVNVGPTPIGGGDGSGEDPAVLAPRWRLQRFSLKATRQGNAH